MVAETRRRVKTNFVHQLEIKTRVHRIYAFTLPEMMYEFTETVTGFIHMTTFNLGVKQFPNNPYPLRRNVQLQSSRLHCEL